MKRAFPILAALALLLAGCTYTSGIDQPVARKFSWFGYLDGDDIRAQCRPGARETWRLVYNARWSEQVRAYDVDLTPGEAILTARVFGAGGNVASFNPFDPQGPWRGVTRQVALDESAARDLRQAIVASAIDRPLERNLSLPSQSFYWIVAGCRDGRFHFNAWLHPSPRFAELTFPVMIFARDPTGIAVYRPESYNAATDFSDRMLPDERTAGGFELRVGENGLLGRIRLF